jgi:predicted RNase H-like HicB family nuclease
VLLTIETERETDGRFIAEVAELPGVLVYATTEDQAVACAQALALRVLAEKIDRGELEPSSLAHIEFERREPVALG